MNLVGSSCHQSCPLDYNDSFRLLYLGPGGENDVITIRLRNARLSNDITYEALSYTWGDASNTGIIQIASELDGSETNIQSVTINCWLALRRLRRADESRALWIDAICINQESTEERNHQLGLMTTIYAKAGAVIAYLGEGDEESDTAMDIIANTLNPPDHRPWHAYHSKRYSTDNVKILSTTPDNCVASLFRQPWFSRIWVLQEITYAKGATVYYGNKILPWQSFIDFVYYNVATKWVEHLPFVLRYSARKSPPLWWNTTTRLLEILEQTRPCGATDPRDKFFAIIPLLERELQLLRTEYPDSFAADFTLEPHINTLTPLPGAILDYSYSASDVFIDLAIYFLKNSGLDILRHVTGPPSRLSSLPSWAPDWSESFQSRYRQVKTNYRRLSICYAGFKKNPFYDTYRAYKAQPDSPSVWDYRVSCFHELRVTAVNCGLIKNIGELCVIDDNIFPLQQWRQLVPQKYLGTHLLNDFLWPIGSLIRTQYSVPSITFTIINQIHLSVCGKWRASFQDPPLQTSASEMSYS